MLVGIVVNNGILYVDTTNQLKAEMPLNDALMESGRIRLRPILMTTLTTILSMIPMVFTNNENAAKAFRPKNSFSKSSKSRNGLYELI